MCWCEADFPLLWAKCNVGQPIEKVFSQLLVPPRTKFEIGAKNDAVSFARNICNPVEKLCGQRKGDHAMAIKNGQEVARSSE